MVKAMSEAKKHPSTGVYYYRQRVPKDISAVARGKSATITINGAARPLRIGDALKVSLGTKDQGEAKSRARDVQDQLDLIWASFRHDEVTLTLKQAVAIAGEVYRDWAALEDDPGSPELWQHVRAMNADAMIGKPYRNHLAIGEGVMIDPMELRFGPLVDVVLTRHNLRITPESRQKVLQHTARAMHEVAGLLGKRAHGDFRPDSNAERFPAFDGIEASQPTPAAKGSAVTFDDIILAEEEHRRIGLGAKSRPLPAATQRKYATIAKEFASFRGSSGDRADTVTGDDLEAWKRSLLTADETRSNSRRTVNYKVGTIKTLVNWGVRRFRGNPSLNRASDSIRSVELPGFEKKPSDISAIRPDEAVQVLRAARLETDSRTRWLPWLCAYSGARINELAALRREDFLETEGFWFFKIHSGGKRSVKNANSVRYVPVHPELIAEGLRLFVERTNKGPLFSSGAADKVQWWFRHKDGAAIFREGVAPSHGWRHLFEDLCIRYGVADSAKKYITGRAKGGSDEDYGKTLARLPGLAREIAKIEAFDID